MKFHYFEISPQIARPLILVTISFKQKLILTEALIDSGSDYCVFPKEAANALNIPLGTAKKSKLTGVLEGKVDLYLYPIKLTIGETSVNIVAGFADEMSRYAPCTLGQHGFFDNFKVCSAKSKLQVEITPK